MEKYDIIFPIGRITYATKFSIKSAFNQSFQYNNFIAVIDTKNEFTYQEILKLLIDLPRVIIKRTYGKGPASARNLAISFSNSEYIAFLDSDDVWNKLKIEHQFRILKNQKANFSLTSYIATDSLLKKPQFYVHLFNKPKYWNLFFCNPIANSSVLCKRKLIKAIGGYVDIPSRNDFATWLKILSDKSCIVSYVNIPLCLLTKNKGSVSKTAKGISSMKLAYYQTFLNTNSSNIKAFVFCACQPIVRIIRKIMLFVFIKFKYEKIVEEFL